MPDSFDGFCSLWPEANPEGSVEEYASSHQPFSKIFLMHIYNFCVISNLFDNYKPYALSTYTIENVRTKCIIFGEALKIKVKQFKRNFPNNYSKSIKIAITECKFSKFSGVACPRTPLKVF